MYKSRAGKIVKFAQALFCIVFCAVSFAIFFRPSNSMAEVDLSALEQGMHHSAVLKLLGPPTEKQEKETKREEVWKYEAAEVVFHEGKVISWATNNAELDAQLILKTKKVASDSDAHVAQKDSTDQVAVAEILSEIMREVPSQPAVKGGRKKGH
ncbi:hypothetical protein OAO01_04280 [Oligoflexia bacterium]|nr:hypothetical protein [Oligoflexia bacterium]